MTPMAVSLANLPEVHHRRCVRYRFRHSDCHRCADACPARALSPGEEGVELDASRCTGCGLCAPACPTEVFHLPAFPTSALTQATGERLTVACQPSGQEGEVRVPCLGDIEPALLASLAQRNVTVTLRGVGHCADCAHASQGGERVAALLAAIKALDDASSGRWPPPAVDDIRHESNHRADRRQFFRRFAHVAVEQLRDETPEVEVPPSAIRAAIPFTPVRRRLAERVLARLDSLPMESPLPRLLGVATLEAHAGRCTGCDACARVCPTGALTVSEVPYCWTLAFQASRCVGCGVCVEACGAEALALQFRWESRGETPVLLHTLPRFQCQECGRFYIGLETQACPVCRDDHDSFEAIFGPE